MQHTDLTLAICMYNASAYIQESLQCVMAQTMQDFHLLILDDCSTDDSVHCVERFFEAQPRQYELLQHAENQGICTMRHLAERHAQTKYMLFVDADDLLSHDFVAKLYTTITSDTDLMAVGCYMDYVDAHGQPTTGGVYLGETTKAGFYAKAGREKLIFMQATAIYDRELALRVGGYCIEGFPSGRPRYQDYCEDLELWTRMSDLYTEGKAIIVLPETLYFYRKHFQGQSANSLPMLLRMRHVKTNLKRRRRGEAELSFIDFQAQYPAEEYQRLEREAKAADALRQGYYHLRQGHLFQGLKHLISSLYHSPTYMADKLKHNLWRRTPKRTDKR